MSKNVAIRGYWSRVFSVESWLGWTIVTLGLCAILIAWLVPTQVTPPESLKWTRQAPAKVEKVIDLTKEPVQIEAFIQRKNPRIFPELAAIITAAIMDASKEFNIPPAFILAWGWIEGEYKHDAVSSAGALGIWQVMPKVWLPTLIKEGILETREDLYNPILNARASAYIIRKLMDQAVDKKVKNVLHYVASGYYGSPQSQEYQRRLLQAIGEFYMQCNVASNAKTSAKLARREFTQRAQEGIG